VTLRRRIGLGALAALGLVLALALWRLPATANLAVDISAKWACQCRYMDGGSDGFCAAEDPIGFGGTKFRYSAETSEVTASIWGLAEATGRYEPGAGCRVR
jgi:hypothetical protein